MDRPLPLLLVRPRVRVLRCEDAIHQIDERAAAPPRRCAARECVEGRWIERYGFVEHTVGRDDGDSLEDGRTSRRRKYRKVIRERPGLAPAALFHLIGNMVFLRLSDVASGLPPEERVLLSSMDTESDAAGLSQRSGYDRLFETLRGALADALSKVRGGGSPPTSRRCSPTPPAARAARRSSSRRPRSGSTRRSRRSSTSWPPSGWPGRRVLVYATHTGTRDITGRMEDFLGRHGFRVAVMKADTVPPERREAWVAKRVEEGVDVLVCHPPLVQRGLDFVEFPTICWYETDYSVYTMRQASRRSLRIGQTEPVQVVFMAYRNTLQADALQLVAKKLRSSPAVEGELPEDGLAAYGDDGDDLMLALARKIVAGEEGEESVEDVFTQAQQVAADAEALLVDAEWRMPEPQVVEVHANGAPISDCDEAAEPQRSLFSWADFIAGEPAEPRRSRRQEAPTLSLFEWALERVQEAELVGAGR